MSTQKNYTIISVVWRLGLIAGITALFMWQVPNACSPAIVVFLPTAKITVELPWCILFSAALLILTISLTLPKEETGNEQC